MTVLQLNVRSLLAHQQELRHLLHTLKNKGSMVDAVLLCETFITNKTLKLINIPDYEIMSNHRENLKGGGTAILLRKNVPYKIRKDLVDFKEKDTEMTYLKITSKAGKSIVLGSLHRSPNTQETIFTNHIKKTTNIVRVEKGNKQLILGMDHNLDLLKSNLHPPTQKFLDTLLDANLLPMIIQPSRIVHKSATLIDNIFISEVLQCNFDSAIIIDDMSDHLPCMALMKQTKLIEFESRNLTDTKIQ